MRARTAFENLRKIVSVLISLKRQGVAVLLKTGDLLKLRGDLYSK